MTVRARNDGEDFHLLWTARRALRLLDPRTGLVAIRIEGSSPAEGPGPESHTELVIDTAEYYGAQEFVQASGIEYCQLKHSTVRVVKEWTQAELAETVKKFAALYRGRCQQYGRETATEKLRFVFVTNRPIAAEVQQAVEAIRQGNPLDDALKVWRASSGLDDTELCSFLHLLRLQGREPGHLDQDDRLRGELCRLSPRAMDTDTRDRLVEFVRSKTLTPAADDPGITKERLLTKLGVRSAEDLFPAPPLFEEIAEVLARDQEAEIARAIREAQAPVLIHAPGGVGKSILARRLPSLMPTGSVAVVFDGFARGEYRQSIQPRHLHSQGLVQVINELAEHGCCDLVLPDETASTYNYLKAVDHRLKQASVVVRQRHPGALVLIVLDAADNSEDAAKDRNEAPSFARDLLQRPPPIGCRIVVLARTERRDRFPDRHHETIEIPLAPFCEAETGRCVRQSFPEASDGHIAEVHRYTGGNPRIQSYLLSRAGSLAELLRRLGPGGLTVDEQISREVADALKELRAHSGDEQGIQSLCASLASLPPRVPTRVLALAAEVEQASIETFVAGLGHALIHLDGFVQFRDEPVETWFRETSRHDGAAAKTVLSRLRGLAEKDTYVAAAWPGLLYQAGQADELFDHALGPQPKIDDVLERRVIVRERLCFALKLAGQRGDLVTSAKLLLRLGEIRAAEELQREILLSNDDLIAALWSPERVRETVFRHRAGDWRGITHARFAAMLAATPGHQTEARRSLRQADDWLREWAQSTTDDEDEYQEDPEDMAAFARARLYLEGSEVCCKWMARWVSPDFRFQLARRLAVSLIDRGEPGLALELLECARDEPYLALGLVCALADAGLASPRATLEAVATAWIAISPETDTASQTDSALTVKQGLIVMGEALVVAGAEPNEALRYVSHILPEIPPYASADPWGFEHYGW